MATTVTAAETTVCRICSDNSATSLEKIDAYIQERVVAIIDAQMKLRNKAVRTEQTLRFKDALGRKFNFPFAIANTWAASDLLSRSSHGWALARTWVADEKKGGMEDLITEAFQNIQLLNQLVWAGYYDLVSEGEVIPPGRWEMIVKPGFYVTMHMWPMEKVASELSGPFPEPRVPLPTRPPGPGICLDSRPLVIRDRVDVLPDEEEAPKTNKRSTFRRLIQWMKGHQKARQLQRHHRR